MDNWGCKNWEEKESSQMVKHVHSGYFCYLRKAPYNKLVRLIITGAFLFNTALMNLAWAREVSPVLSPVGAAANSGLGHSMIDQIKIPEEYGSLKESFKGSSDKLIIQIQDIHSNYEGQKNLANILISLIKDHRLKVILIEGGITDRDFSYLRMWHSLEERKEKAEKLLKDGVLTGEAYVNIATDYPLKFQGAEDRSLYEKNMDAFLKTRLFMEEGLRLVKKLRNIVDNLKRHIYNRRLKKFDKGVNAYHNKETDFMDYLGLLEETARRNNVALEKFGNFISILNLTDLEKRIDFKKVEAERDSLIEKIIDSGSDKIAEELYNKGKEFKEGSIDQNKFYTYLVDLTKTSGIDLGGYKNLTAYVDYINAYSQLDISNLFNEISKLEDEITTSLCRNEDEKKLSKISKHIGIVDKFLKLKLIPQDYSYFRDNKNDFFVSSWLDFLRVRSARFKLTTPVPDDATIIDDNIPTLETFYKAAVDRDDAFVRNSIKKMEKENENLACLIAGGFHTENLTQLFREKGISYLIIAPKAKVPTDDKAYRKELMQSYANRIWDEIGPDLVSESQLRRSSPIETRTSVLEVNRVFGEDMINSVLQRDPRLRDEVRQLIRERAISDVDTIGMVLARLPNDEARLKFLSSLTGRDAKLADRERLRSVSDLFDQLGRPGPGGGFDLPVLFGGMIGGGGIYYLTTSPGGAGIGVPGETVTFRGYVSPEGTIYIGEESGLPTLLAKGLSRYWGLTHPEVGPAEIERRLEEMLGRGSVTAEDIEFAKAITPTRAVSELEPEREMLARAAAPEIGGVGLEPFARHDVPRFNEFTHAGVRPELRDMDAETSILIGELIPILETSFREAEISQQASSELAKYFGTAITQARKEWLESLVVYGYLTAEAAKSILAIGTIKGLSEEEIKTRASELAISLTPSLVTMARGYAAGEVVTPAITSAAREELASRLIPYGFYEIVEETQAGFKIGEAGVGLAMYAAVHYPEGPREAAEEAVEAVATSPASDILAGVTEGEAPGIEMYAPFLLEKKGLGLYLMAKHPGVGGRREAIIRAVVEAKAFPQELRAMTEEGIPGITRYYAALSQPFVSIWMALNYPEKARRMEAVREAVEEAIALGQFITQEGAISEAEVPGIPTYGPTLTHPSIAIPFVIRYPGEARREGMEGVVETARNVISDEVAALGIPVSEQEARALGQPTPAMWLTSTYLEGGPRAEAMKAAVQAAKEALPAEVRALTEEEVPGITRFAHAFETPIISVPFALLHPEVVKRRAAIGRDVELAQAVSTEIRSITDEQLPGISLFAEDLAESRVTTLWLAVYHPAGPEQRVEALRKTVGIAQTSPLEIRSVTEEEPVVAQFAKLLEQPGVAIPLAFYYPEEAQRRKGIKQLVEAAGESIPEQISAIAERRPELAPYAEALKQPEAAIQIAAESLSAPVEKREAARGAIIEEKLEIAQRLPEEIRSIAAELRPEQPELVKVAEEMAGQPEVIARAVLEYPEETQRRRAIEAALQVALSLKAEFDVTLKAALLSAVRSPAYAKEYLEGSREAGRMLIARTTPERMPRFGEVIKPTKGSKVTRIFVSEVSPDNLVVVRPQIGRERKVSAGEATEVREGRPIVRVAPMIGIEKINVITRDEATANPFVYRLLAPRGAVVETPWMSLVRGRSTTERRDVIATFAHLVAAEELSRRELWITLHRMQVEKNTVPIRIIGVEVLSPRARADLAEIIGEFDFVEAATTKQILEDERRVIAIGYEKDLIEGIEFVRIREPTEEEKARGYVISAFSIFSAAFAKQAELVKIISKADLTRLLDDIFRYIHIDPTEGEYQQKIYQIYQLEREVKVKI